MPSKTNLVELSSITSFSDVLAELKRLDTQLTKHDLEQFVTFNTAYLVVTADIEQATKNNYFDDNAFVEKFSVCFAKYYFTAINQTAAHDPKLKPAWVRLNQAGRSHRVPLSLTLLIGANAHINHDLPYVLHELLSAKTAPKGLKDLIKINKLLMKSGKKVIPKIQEPNAVLDYLKQHFALLYYRPVMYLILIWRVRAWHRFQKLK